MSDVARSSLPVLVVASADAPMIRNWSASSSHSMYAPADAPKNLTSWPVSSTPTVKVPVIVVAAATDNPDESVITPSVIIVSPIVKSVLASIVVPVIAAAAKVPPATVRVFEVWVRVTSPLLKLITEASARNKSDHIRLPVPSATPSLVVG